MLLLCGSLAASAEASQATPAADRPQAPAAGAARPQPQTPPPTGPTAVLPPGYTIGLEDVIGVLFWRDTDMSGDFVVRPDGKISVPLLNDVEVVGLTPEQLRSKLLDLARKYVEEPNVTVVVRTINSRKVFITGYITRPGSYALTAPTTVLQLIATAGGLTDFANREEIAIVRPGEKNPLKFNYNDVIKGKNPQQNIELRIGDTVVVSD